MTTKTIELLPFVEYRIVISEADGNITSPSKWPDKIEEAFSGDMKNDIKIKLAMTDQVLLDFPSFTPSGFSSPVVMLKIADFVPRDEIRFPHQQKMTIVIERDGDADFEVFAAPSCVRYQ